MLETTVDSVQTFTVYPPNIKQGSNKSTKNRIFWDFSQLKNEERTKLQFILHQANYISKNKINEIFPTYSTKKEKKHEGYCEIKRNLHS